MKAFVVFVGALLVAGVASAACTEGSRGYITKYNPTTGKAKDEYRTCVNGSFMNAEERAAYVYNPRAACTEGAAGYVTSYNSEGKEIRHPRICQNGSFMTAAEQAAYVRVPKNRCKEGSRYLETNHNDPSDRTVYTSKVCVNGKWVTAKN